MKNDNDYLKKKCPLIKQCLQIVYATSESPNLCRFVNSELIFLI